MQTHEIRQCCPTCPPRRHPTAAGLVLQRLDLYHTRAVYEDHVAQMKALLKS